MIRTRDLLPDYYDKCDNRSPRHRHGHHPDARRMTSSQTHSSAMFGPVVAMLLAVVAFAWTTSAAALDFRVDFRNSTYQSQIGDTFSDLLAQHESEVLIQSTVTTGLENISTSVYAGGVNNNYSMMMMATLDVGTSGLYEFQVGTDWGRGGATALIDNSDGSIVSERIIIGDTWWGNDFNNPDVFTTTFNFNVGESYTLVWVGFEGCCGGSSTIRFSVDGGAFVPFTESNFLPFTAIPEPSTAILLGLGMLMFALDRQPGTLRTAR